VDEDGAAAFTVSRRVVLDDIDWSVVSQVGHPGGRRALGWAAAKPGRAAVAHRQGSAAPAAPTSAGPRALPRHLRPFLCGRRAGTPNAPPPIWLSHHAGPCRRLWAPAPTSSAWRSGTRSSAPPWWPAASGAPATTAACCVRCTSGGERCARCARVSSGVLAWDGWCVLGSLLDGNRQVAVRLRPARPVGWVAGWEGRRSPLAPAVRSLLRHCWPRLHRNLPAPLRSGAAQDFDVDWGQLVRGRNAAQARRRWRLMAKVGLAARHPLRERPPNTLGVNGCQTCSRSLN
jgi:hypothetical protein